MQKGIYLLIGVVAFMFTGCEQKPQSNVSTDAPKVMESIQLKAEKTAKTIDAQVDKMAEEAAKLQEVKEQVKSLIAEANKLLNNQDFEAAINKAKMILAIEPESSEAKSIIERAKAALAKIAEEKAAELKAAANDAVGDMKSKLGNLGN